MIETEGSKGGVKRDKFLFRLLAVPELGVVVALIICISIFQSINPVFLSGEVVGSIIQAVTFVSIIAVGQAFLLSDQKVGAAIGWAMGEIPIVVALIATFIQWMRSDAREASRADKRSAVDLAEYNEYLQKLSSREDK